MSAPAPTPLPVTPPIIPNDVDADCPIPKVNIRPLTRLLKATQNRLLSPVGDALDLINDTLDKYRNVLCRLLASSQPATVPGSLGEREFVFNLAAGTAPIIVGTNVTPPRVITYNVPKMTLLEVCGAARDAPTGSDLIIDVLLDGVSVFGPAPLTILAGSVSTHTILPPNFSSGANPLTFTYHSRFTIDVLQVGSTYPGRAIFVGVRYKLS